MVKKGSELIFISRILRDGSGTIKIESQDEVSHVQNTVFELKSLSISNGTYIASEFNSYVVKVKEQKKDFLTKEEVIIIQMICDEKNTKQIAATIGVGDRCIDKKRRAIIQKVGVLSVAGLVKYAILNGISYPFLNIKNNNE